MTDLRTVAPAVELEFDSRGHGDPVLFIHGGLCADSFARFIDEPALSGYQRIRYHRVGYDGSSRITGPASIEEQAAQGRALLAALDLGPAHVVGHSSGAAIALQLALDHPPAVASLALLETALLSIPSGPFALDALRAFGEGRPGEAVDTWLCGVGGPDAIAVLERDQPGSRDRAVAAAETFFTQELPALRDWAFTATEAARVSQPVLAVLGARSHEVSSAYPERHARLLTWLPRAESFVLPGATHLLHAQNPTALAEALARFFPRH